MSKQYPLQFVSPGRQAQEPRPTFRRRQNDPAQQWPLMPLPQRSPTTLHFRAAAGGTWSYRQSEDGTRYVFANADAAPDVAPDAASVVHLPPQHDLRRPFTGPRQRAHDIQLDEPTEVREVEPFDREDGRPRHL